ncbi:hypothetical protein Ahy_B03g064473 [Arachis hypogaea]|uniref:Aminotransferase-like plant mobile domain-containing protein n=1 Tax=Arachis hypogaea TaxID=3818 RepID=A0A444ZZM6_ARAHY|nr:hypothetical protein Ahy_B03g064473 [Arachis hypogaea]
MGDNPDRLYRLDGFVHIAGVINEEVSVYIEGGRLAWLFGDKSSTRLHIRWLPYVARLEDMGGYSWESAALSWLYRCMYRVANKNVVKLAGPLQLLQSWIFWRFSGFRPARYDTFHWLLASR